MNLIKLKERIAARIGLTLPQNRQEPKVQSLETIAHEGISIEKLTYESEKGIIIPTLLIKPKNVNPGTPVYIYASDKGKPHKSDNSLLPFLLADNGFIVLAIDVRGIDPVNELGEILDLKSASSIISQGENLHIITLPYQYPEDILDLLKTTFNKLN